MAAIDHFSYTPSAYPFDGVIARVSRAANAVSRRARAFVAYHQTLSSLSTLSDRQLEDIGLDAMNLNAVAREMAHRNTL